MSLTLYYAQNSSSSPVTWVMAELGLEHEAIEIDLKAGDQHKPELRVHNPMGEVPTLVDGGHGMFESSAIIIYLGQRYGVERDLWPALDSNDHMDALAWTAWFSVPLMSAMRMVMLNTGDRWPAEMRNEPQAAKGRERLGELIAVLDERLGGRPYVTGDHFTLVDAYGAALTVWSTRHLKFDLTQAPNVGAWLERCMSREAVAQMK